MKSAGMSDKSLDKAVQMYMPKCTFFSLVSAMSPLPSVMDCACYREFCTTKHDCSDVSNRISSYTCFWKAEYHSAGSIPHNHTMTYVHTSDGGVPLRCINAPEMVAWCRDARPPGSPQGLQTFAGEKQSSKYANQKKIQLTQGHKNKAKKNEGKQSV